MSPMPSELQRLCFALDLYDDPDLIARYKSWHSPGCVPKPVLEALHRQDVRTLDIYNCGNRLFMIMEVGPSFDPVLSARQDAKDPDVQAWQKMMWEFQKPLPFAKADQKWVPMTQIFSLDET